ncbi:P2 phage tail completion protein R (GpR) [Bordetella ansorpii]|uniref:p2 phage tail completion protein R (GpR) n=1 Tax=Bordetella ansorpii TaxID=288768 RepID=A0A157QNL0_9BORD|nr:phage tail protein [Bordetella ansorpii]SAI47443.1 P2 phage tail completion protein R (GpR) [Bordetella ansorpii]
MRKPTELRAWLTAANPLLAANPDRLSIFVDGGAVVCTGAASLSHEYRYTLNLIVQDYTGAPAAVVLPILAWLRTEQPEQFENPALRERMLQLDVELLQNDAVDLSIQLQLTERVIVQADPQTGKLAARHVGEPPHPDLPPDDGEWRVTLDGELIATFPFKGYRPQL